MGSGVVGGIQPGRSSGVVVVRPDELIARVEAIEKEREELQNSIAVGYRQAAQKIPTGIWVRIKLDKAERDPGGHLNLAEGFYVVPSDGYYHISGTVSLLETKNALIAGIGLNGSNSTIVGTQIVSTVESAESGVVTGILRCKKGDLIELHILHTAGVEKTLQVGSELCRLNVARIA